MTDVPVDPGVVHRTPAVEGLTEVEEEELRAELAKVPWFLFSVLRCSGVLLGYSESKTWLMLGRAVAGLPLAFCVSWAISLHAHF